jgi:hypothetical protein
MLENTEGQSRMNNPEKLATLCTQEEDKKQQTNNNNNKKSKRKIFTHL